MNSSGRIGLLAGTGAYLLWGLFPLYWPLLEPASAVEILGHRIVWSALTTAALVLLLSRRRELMTILTTPRQRGLLTLAAVVVAVNWGTYIWAVNQGRVVETSLGYFINPLVTVVFGVLVFGERLRRLQVVALTLASIAVLVLTVDYGRPPWIALILAFSFGTYGVAKKSANVGAVESLTFETWILAPVALAVLLWLGGRGETHFTTEGAAHVVLLVLTGLVTTLPLLLFGAAAIRVPLISLGLLQYLAPVIQFLLGVLLLDEAMPTVRWIGFALVWTALAIFTWDAVRGSRAPIVVEPVGG